MNLATAVPFISRQVTRRYLPRVQLKLHRRRSAFSTLLSRRCCSGYLISQPALPRQLSCSIASCRTPQPFRSSHRAQFHAVPPLRDDSATPDGDKKQQYKAADISTDTYHELADSTLDDLFLNMEGISDSNPEVDVDYSAGVMTLSNPEGTWVINKQPPNKQIWLSSPVSGPKRYDWVKMDESGNPREESDGEDLPGDWVYLRDGQTMKELLQEELDVTYEIILE